MKYLNKNFIFYYIFPILLLLLFFIFTGYKTSTDTQRFIEWSNEINFSIKNNILYLYDERGIDGVMFYISVIYFKITFLFREHWKEIFLFSNILCFIYTLVLFKKNFSEIIKIYQFLPYFLLLNYDYLNWSNYILTDFFFSFLVFMFITNLIFTKNNIITSALLVLIILTRPPGIVLVFITMQYFYLNSSIDDSKKFRYKIFILLMFYILFIFLSSYLIINNIFFESLSDTFQYHRSYFLEGIIINDRPHTYVENPNDILDIIKIILLRFLNFFFFIDKLFSFKHNLINLIIFLPLYSLSLLAIFNFNSFNKTQKKVILAMLLSVISFCFFHSILLIDYDWRYRLPCILPISIITLISIEKLLSSYKLLKIFT